MASSMQRFHCEAPVKCQQCDGTHRTEATIRTAGLSCVAPFKEPIMFADLSTRLGTMFAPFHHHDRERDAYLAASSDLVDLERRMRQCDHGGYPISGYSNGVQHAWTI
jgi:hypothetical protein